MRKSYLLFVSILSLALASIAQEDARTFSNNYDPIRLELEEWDPIRGPWLATSLEAMSNQQAIPDRTFPEDITPAEMVAALPEKTRSNIERIAMANTSGNESEQAQWNEIRRVVVRPGAGCGRRSARTYGDPHLVTFDGARYSFQTVGEFVLSKSTSGFEVQARQKPQRDDFSLNTAVAMNVGGDRVCVYSEDYPDGNRATPVRVNGNPVVVNANKAYFLRNGGTIRQSGRTYTIAWPTGEKVTAQMRRSGGMSFMNVNVQITDCSEGLFTGLLGNANGRESDDFQGMNDNPNLRMTAGSDPFGSMSRELEQRRLAFLANALADEYRVTHATTLFDYPIGTSTITFTDRSFPRVHRTISEIPRDRRETARRNCEQRGISARDMNGCIFDNSHLDLEPEPQPIVEDPSDGRIDFEQISQAEPNVNQDVKEAQREIEGNPIKGEDAVKGEESIKDKEVNTKPRLTPIPLPDEREKPKIESRVKGTENGRTTPTRTTPTRTTPTRTTPTRTTPTRTTPTRTTPTRTTPTRTTPTRTTPTRTTPTRTTPTRTTPTRTTPTKVTPSRGGR